jgi:hypothetical protein
MFCKWDKPDRFRTEISDRSQFKFLFTLFKEHYNYIVEQINFDCGLSQRNDHFKKDCKI